MWVKAKLTEKRANTPVVKEKPLEKYTIENLSKRNYAASEIVLDEATATASAYTAYKFHYESDGKTVTGLAHIPVSCVDKCPVIAQFRGYADKDGYYSGYGTQHSAEYFAQNGFISLAPDFLGYGGSASQSANIWEERFETYTTAVNLIKAIEKWDKTEPGKIGIWGHSNGGQITLTTLEVTGTTYPTVLWAPVSAPFPYSILYYTGDNDDHGKLLRKELAGFEADYDAEKYALINYYDLIKAPILLQQGSGDDQVPQKWSDLLAKKLTDLKVNLTYEVYQGADHNLAPDWDVAVKKDVVFFKTEFK